MPKDPKWIEARFDVERIEVSAVVPPVVHKGDLRAMERRVMDYIRDEGFDVMHVRAEAKGGDPVLTVVGEVANRIGKVVEGAKKEEEAALEAGREEGGSDTA